MKIVKIKVDFPVGVEVSNVRQQQLDVVLRAICQDYRETHPGHVMWPLGCGAKMLANPLALSNDEPTLFDDSVYHVEIAERERIDESDL